ncbi:hypothetical protein G9A89_006205 [Geosiphon pyriformis]|nr:hypothetical protein G9A89_006205 [Geosiphon pyriformis]
MSKINGHQSKRTARRAILDPTRPSFIEGSESTTSSAVSFPALLSPEMINSNTANISIKANSSINLNPQFVEELLAKLDPALVSQLMQQITLKFESLITPKLRSRRGQVPRPQNPFVLYRRDIQERLTQQRGKEVGANLPLVSRAASKSWQKEPQDIRNIYELLGDIAKKVHEKVYPNYVYKPRKRKDKNPPKYDFDEEELLIDTETGLLSPNRTPTRGSSPGSEGVCVQQEFTIIQENGDGSRHQLSSIYLSPVVVNESTPPPPPSPLPLPLPPQRQQDQFVNHFYHSSSDYPQRPSSPRILTQMNSSIVYKPLRTSNNTMNNACKNDSSVLNQLPSISSLTTSLQSSSPPYMSLTFNDQQGQNVSNWIYHDQVRNRHTQQQQQQQQRQLQDSQLYDLPTTNEGKRSNELSRDLSLSGTCECTDCHQDQGIESNHILRQINEPTTPSDTKDIYGRKICRLFGAP